MKQIQLYYFSGTGNTQWAANYLTAELTEAGLGVDCHSIEQVLPGDVANQLATADHLVIGFPVYGSTAPRPMTAFLQALPPARQHQQATIFATQALASGDSAHYIGQILTAKGYTLLQTRHFRMMNNLHLPSFWFYKPQNGENLTASLEQIKPSIDRLAGEIVADQTHLIGRNPFGTLLGSLQRKFVDRMIDKLGTTLSAENQLCTHCGLCSRICPAGNITDPDSLGVAFGRGCVGCLRCYSQCPTTAILSGKASTNTASYPRYRGPEGVQFQRPLFHYKTED